MEKVNKLVGSRSDPKSIQEAMDDDEGMEDALEEFLSGFISRLEKTEG